MLNFLKNGKGKILALFFSNPDKEYYLREIAKLLNEEPGAIQNHLNSLSEEKILLDHRMANLRFFKLNKNYPLYEEIKRIVSKTIGIEAKLKKLSNKFLGIEFAFIYGSIAKNAENSTSDIDLMIIGEVDEDKLIQQINRLEEELKREINYTIYRRREFKKKLDEGNEFISEVMKEPQIILKGDLNEL